MKNVSFVGGPLNGTDRILQDYETEYIAIKPKPIPFPTDVIYAPKQVEIEEIKYRESRPGSLLFICQSDH